MAYIDPNQDDQEEQQQGTPASNDPTQAPSSASAVESQTQSYSPNTPTSGTQGTGFQNLNSYLDANQGNTLSTQLAGKVKTQADQAQQDLQGAQSQFKSSVDENTVNYDQDNANRVLGDPGKASADDTAKFQAQMNANYQGPQDANQFGAFSNAQNLGRKAYNESQAAKTEGGKLSLLNNYFQTPTYNQGQRSLDSALLSGGDQTAFNDLQNQVQNYPSEFQTAAQDLNTYGSKGAATTAASRASARQGLGIDDSGNFTGKQTNGQGDWAGGGAIGSALNSINSDQINANNRAAQSYSSLVGQFASPHMVPGAAGTYAEGKLFPQVQMTIDQERSLGLPVDKQGTTYAFNPSKIADYIKQAGPATLNNAADPEHVAKLSALSQLAQLPQTWVDPSQAGTYKDAPWFNTALLLNEQADLLDYNKNPIPSSIVVPDRGTPVPPLQNPYDYRS